MTERDNVAKRLARMPSEKRLYSLKTLPRHLEAARRWERLRLLLTDFGFLDAKLDALRTQALLEDYDLILSAGSSGGDAAGFQAIRGALRLGTHVLDRDAAQLANQLRGRLPRKGAPSVRRLLRQLEDEPIGPGLRLLTPSLRSPDTSLLRSLSGHTMGIEGVAMTPDGRRAISASVDGTLKVWDVETGQEQHTLRHDGAVFDVAVTPDGRRAISASADDTLKIWHLGSGEELRTLRGHTESVHLVRVTPDGQRAVSGSWDTTIRVWDLEHGTERETLRGHTSEIVTLALSLDGRYLVSAARRSVDFDLAAQRQAVTPDGISESGCQEPLLMVWDLATCREHYRVEQTGFPVQQVNRVCTLPDGRHVLAELSDGTLRRWQIERPAEQSIYADAQTHGRLFALLSEGCTVLSAAHGGTLTLWDLETGESQRILRGHTEQVHAVAVSSNEQRAVSAGGELYDLVLRVWDLSGESVSPGSEQRQHSGALSRVAVTSDGRTAVTGCRAGELKVWDLEQRSLRHSLRAESGHGTLGALTTTPDGRHAIAGYAGGQIVVSDLVTGSARHSFKGHLGEITDLAVTPDGRRLVSVARGLRVRDLETGREVLQLRGQDHKLTSVAVAPDGRCAIAASELPAHLRHDGFLSITRRLGRWGKFTDDLIVWDLDSGQQRMRLQGHSKRITTVKALPDGRGVLSASEDATLRLWDLADGEDKAVLEGHGDRVTVVVLLDAGRLAVSGSLDETLRVWNLESGRLERTLGRDLGWIQGLAAVPGRPWVIAASADCSLQLWDVESGTRLAVVLGDHRCPCCAVTPDGQMVLAGDDEGRVHLFAVDERGEL